MKLKTKLSKPFAYIVTSQIKKWAKKPVYYQNKVFGGLIKSAANTSFGKDHGFKNIKSYSDFKERVPLRTYEQLKPYIERIKEGERDVLWSGRPIYFAKTSGTTSGTKYIPITKESIKNHIRTARNTLLTYIAETGKADFVSGKMMFLSGSPELEKTGDILTGRLSGIVNHHVPGYLTSNQVPSKETNRIEDWEEKIEKVVDETINKDLRVIGGIPPWVQMYFERLKDRTEKTVREIFPNFSVFVHGGVSFTPYKGKIEESLGSDVALIETYPSSEGFIAFQDSQKTEALLLNLNEGIFFEFVPADEVFSENPTRLSIEDVELDVNYAIVLNTNAGLWGYILGDTVKFVSKNPYRIIVTGRTEHFISAFGEHVIAGEVESALHQTAKEANAAVMDFTVAPQVTPESDELPYHEWFIDFSKEPEDLNKFAQKLDELMQQKNSYYEDLIQGKILQPLKIRITQKNAFRSYMKSIGKLGGQNKVPHLSNNRKIADKLVPLLKQQADQQV